MLARAPHPSLYTNTGAGVASSASSPDAQGGAGAAAGASSAPRRALAAPVFLGLDQDASRVAFARGFLEIGPEQGLAPETGTIGLPAWTGPNGLFDPGPPLAKVEDVLTDQILRYGVTHVFSEATYIGDARDAKSRKMQIQLAMVAGVVAMACFRAYVRFGNSVYHRAVTPLQWRAEFIGSIPKHLDSQAERRAWYKDEAIGRCQKRGWPASSEHEAEACGVLNYGLCLEYPDYRTSWDPLFWTRRHSS